MQEWDRISCLERMYPVNLMMKMCQVVIRQCEGYRQHKPEAVGYCEPFCDFLHQIQCMLQRESFEEITTIAAFFVNVLLTLGLHAVFIEFCKIYG